MSTYLLTWNPNKWPWHDLDDCIAEIETLGFHEDTWSCGRNKQITIGDRLFLIRQGKEPRGIVASGWAVSGFFEDDHWDQARQAEGQSALYIWMRFITLLDADHEPILSRDSLNHGVMGTMHWDSQVSGIQVPDEIANQLEIAWARFLATKNIIEDHNAQDSIILPEELVESEQYYEGAKKQIVVNAYERNSKARKKCLEHYGLSCYVCGFNFEKEYGDIGVGFIHVHHVIPLSDLDHEYALDPIRDLRPVCPNCHAMIHRQRPPFTIEDIRRRWEDALNKAD
jgi:5-methylcytosine-specific restriction protein A